MYGWISKTVGFFAKKFAARPKKGLATSGKAFSESRGAGYILVLVMTLVVLLAL